MCVCGGWGVWGGVGVVACVGGWWGACVRACVRAGVRACVCACVGASMGAIC